MEKTLELPLLARFCPLPMGVRFGAAQFSAECSSFPVQVTEGRITKASGTS